jgi:hypothetical protein
MLDLDNFCIDAADCVEMEPSSAFGELIATNAPGTELRLRVCAAQK